MTTGRVSFDGCGCCAEYIKVEVIGEVLMPDGKTLLQVQEVGGEGRWWVDTDFTGLFMEY